MNRIGMQLQKVVLSLIVWCGMFSTASAQEVAAAQSNELKIVFPKSRMVYQRDNQDRAWIRITGYCPQGTTAIEARLLARNEGQGKSTRWTPLRADILGTSFSAVLEGTAGWYDLQVRATRKKSKPFLALVERVGIGEVFVAAGHSVAQGGEINDRGAQDDRVSTVAIQPQSAGFQNYLRTGDLYFLPDVEFTHADSGVALAPFGHSNYFWSSFAERIAQRENVPVLIFNAAFGGSTLDQWAKSTRNIQFVHGFVRSYIRMPYINVYNTLRKYVSLTGIRAILSDHGQNDAGEKDPDRIFANYRQFILQARSDLGYPHLAVVVNRQHPSPHTAVRAAQERMIKEPDCFPGPDYDAEMEKEDRYDGIHLSRQGLDKAARIWAEALTADFFRDSRPWLPSY